MKLLSFSIIILIFTGCNTSDSSKEVPSATRVTEQKKDSFFPVTSFLKGQIAQFASLPVTPLHTITINNKTDSIWIKREQLSALLAGFLSPKISETNLTDYFKETSFKDLTLNSITLTYDPIKLLPDSIPLLHWDVYINPESGKIQKIYMVKQLKNKENLIREQLTWQTDKSATITTLTDKNKDNKMQVLRVDKFIWNFNE